MNPASDSRPGSDLVARWFGPRFAQLHPLLQRLHREGGRLAGPVEIGFGSGLAGFLGRRLARKLGLPLHVGRAQLRVDISHTADALVWARRFSQPGEPGMDMVSRFEPIGKWPHGYWLERTGALQFRLTVDVDDGGWQWRVLGATLHGFPLPVKLLPQSHAGKRVQPDGSYRFEVLFAAPLLGPLVWYRGHLALSPAGSPAGSPRP